MKKVLIAGLLPFVLASCGGGAGTASTPKPAQQVATVSTNTTTTNYQQVAASGGRYALAQAGTVVVLDDNTPDGSPVVASINVPGGQVQVCNAAAFGGIAWKDSYSCYIEQK